MSISNPFYWREDGAERGYWDVSFYRGKSINSRIISMKGGRFCWRKGGLLSGISRLRVNYRSVMEPVKCWLRFWGIKPRLGRINICRLLKIWFPFRCPRHMFRKWSKRRKKIINNTLNKGMILWISKILKFNCWIEKYKIFLVCWVIFDNISIKYQSSKKNLKKR